MKWPELCLFCDVHAKTTSTLNIGFIREVNADMRMAKEIWTIAYFFIWHGHKRICCLLHTFRLNFHCLCLHYNLPQFIYRCCVPHWASARINSKEVLPHETFQINRFSSLDACWWYLRVLSTCSILDVCQACAESHGNIFNCNKTVCMTFKD